MRTAGVAVSSDGNPVARDYGEQRANGGSLESGRGWYYGAGACVALEVERFAGWRKRRTIFVCRRRG